MRTNLVVRVTSPSYRIVYALSSPTTTTTTTTTDASEQELHNSKVRQIAIVNHFGKSGVLIQEQEKFKEMPNVSDAVFKMFCVETLLKPFHASIWKVETCEK